MTRHAAPAPERSGTGLGRGVLALLLPPVAWLLSLFLSYAVEDFWCSAAANTGRSQPGTALEVVLLALNAALLALTVLAGVVGVLASRRTGGSDPAARTARFTGYLGVVLAVVFGFGIILIAGNVFLLEVCG